MAILRKKKHPVGFYNKLHNGLSIFVPFKHFSSRKYAEIVPIKTSKFIKCELKKLNYLILKHLTCSSTKSPLIKCEMEPSKLFCNYLTKNYALTNRYTDFCLLNFCF